MTRAARGPFRLWLVVSAVWLLLLAFLLEVFRRSVSLSELLPLAVVVLSLRCSSWRSGRRSCGPCAGARVPPAGLSVAVLSG
jgi:hypothetical protein